MNASRIPDSTHSTSTFRAAASAPSIPFSSSVVARIQRRSGRIFRHLAGRVKRPVRLVAVAAVFAAAAAAVAPPAAAETGWPTAWWPKKLARTVFAGQLDVPRAGVRCFPLGKGRPSGVPSFRLYHRFMCSSPRLTELYRVRATRGTVDEHGDWQYRLVIELRIVD